tara:strand:- start:316 stop:660 length:345 start_codon:yes stop_codon:yes gene_type:complete
MTENGNNMDSINSIEKKFIILKEDLARIFDVHVRTIDNHLKDAAEKYPEKECLRRKLGSKWFCFGDELREVITLTSSASRETSEYDNLTEEERNQMEEAFDNYVELQSDILRNK